MLRKISEELGFSVSSHILVKSKTVEQKCCDPDGHGDEMLLHQLSLSPRSTDLCIRVGLTMFLEELPQITLREKQKISMLAGCLAHLLTNHQSHSSEAGARIVCEVAAACVIEGHTIDKDIQDAVLHSIASSQDLVEAEKEFLIHKLTLVHWR
jgi:hypothetical protein